MALVLAQVASLVPTMLQALAAVPELAAFAQETGDIHALVAKAIELGLEVYDDELPAFLSGPFNVIFDRHGPTFRLAYITESVDCEDCEDGCVRTRCGVNFARGTFDIGIRNGDPFPMSEAALFRGFRMELRRPADSLDAVVGRDVLHGDWPHVLASFRAICSAFNIPIVAA